MTSIKDMRWPLQEARVKIVIKNAVTDGTAKMSSPQSSWVAGSDEGKSLPKLHVGERFLLRQFRATIWVVVPIVMVRMIVAIVTIVVRIVAIPSCGWSHAADSDCADNANCRSDLA